MHGMSLKIALFWAAVGARPNPLASPAGPAMGLPNNFGNMTAVGRDKQATKIGQKSFLVASRVI